MPIAEEKKIGVAEAKAHLSEIVDEVLKGEAVYTITKYNVPAVRIEPVDESIPKEPKARGALSKYADLSKIPLEEGAWERAVEKRYAGVTRH